LPSSPDIYIRNFVPSKLDNIQKAVKLINLASKAKPYGCFASSSRDLGLSFKSSIILSV